MVFFLAPVGCVESQPKDENDVPPDSKLSFGNLGDRSIQAKQDFAIVNLKFGYPLVGDMACVVHQIVFNPNIKRIIGRRDNAATNAHAI